MGRPESAHSICRGQQSFFRRRADDDRIFKQLNERIRGGHRAAAAIELICRHSRFGTLAVFVRNNLVTRTGSVPSRKGKDMCVQRSENECGSKIAAAVD
jgi:hypothetical protein